MAVRFPRDSKVYIKDEGLYGTVVDSLYDRCGKRMLYVVSPTMDYYLADQLEPIKRDGND